MALRVLIVEDDASIRLAVREILRAEGYETVEAERGEEGLRAAFGAGADLVLLDLMLPGTPGLDVLREIRAALPTLPVIVLTARGAEPDRVRGLRLGADDYVVKPFGRDELLARIEAVLRRCPARPEPVALVALPGCEADLGARLLRFADGAR